ncbi:hypothetical protein GCM10007884_27610 [Methylobacterium brachythecii]|uniref:DUF6894 domain-containing protein n=1 Tax=Methylobacterium brachythecii TaxID=1176177 RepID=A0ABQ6D326_9HYPH|nr:hypothetical protein GCM10007884_27610 [Methylobacterium brachythecii]
MSPDRASAWTLARVAVDRRAAFATGKIAHELSNPAKLALSFLTRVRLVQHVIAQSRQINGELALSRYFFDIDDGSVIHDEIGREIRDDRTLRREALGVVTALMAAEAEDAKETTLVLSARDEAGKLSLKVRMVCQVEEL